MAVRREFGTEKQPGEWKGRSAPQNAKPAKAENVDALVSRFLAELTDLSSEMDRSGSPVNAGTVEAETEQINSEIEDSLAELETLKPRAKVATEGKELSAARDREKPADPSHSAKHAPEPVPPPQLETVAPSDSEEQAWNRLEIFRTGVVQKTVSPRPSILWVIAGAVLLGILAIAGFYYFTSDTSIPAVPAPPPAPETTEGAPIVFEKADAKTEPESLKSAKAETPVKTSAEGRNKPAPKNQAQNAAKSPDTESARGNRPAAGSDTRRQAEQSSRTAVSVNPPEEHTSAASVPATAPPSQPSVPAADVVPPPPPPKVQPPAPEPGTSSAAITVNTPARETSAPAAKTAVSPDVPADTPAPAKSIAVLQAEPVKKVPPVYPPLARSRKVSGIVEVETEINNNGDVFRAKAVSGPVMLRQAAEEALMKWKFKPASVNGVNVPSRARISVVFNLQ